MAVNYTKGIKNLDMDTIYITAGGYVNYPFKGIARNSLLGIDVPTFSGSLSRDIGKFALYNIEDIAFGIVSRAEINFKYMSAEDYLVLCKMAKERVQFVNFFNRDKGERETMEMAITNIERGNLCHYGANNYVGNFDVVLKLVATNRDKEEYNTPLTVKYNANGGSGVIEPQEKKWSENIEIKECTFTAPSGKSFKEWNTKASGVGGESFGEHQRKTLWKSLNLYAIWE